MKESKLRDEQLMYWPSDRSAGDWPLSMWPPGVIDLKRRRFLACAVQLKPELKTRLLEARSKPGRLKKWAEAYHLSDPWCARLLLHDDDKQWLAALMSGVKVPDSRLAAVARAWDPQPIPAAEVDRWAAKVSPLLAADVGELGEENDDDDLECPYPGNRIGLAGPQADLRLMPRLLKLDPFSFSPVLERPGEFKKRVLASVEAAINDHCKQTIAEAQRLGLRSRGERVKRGKTLDTHFMWLARRQILGEGDAAIAAAAWSGTPGVGLAPSNARIMVHKAISRLATDIELTLRKLKPLS